MPTYRFSGPSLTAQRGGICPVCKKRGRRQTTITRTVNPFNTNPDGSVKTYAEVFEDVKREVREWEGVPFVHAGCES